MRSHDQKPRDWVGLIAREPVEPGNRIEDFGTVTRYAFSSALGHIASASISKKSLVDGEIVEVSTGNGKVKAEVRHMPLLRG
jgi:glycine cleavage system aminomethyltransferase T